MRDWFAEAFGGAVSDIRQKLIDEAWFGRHPVSTQHSAPCGHDNARAPERDVGSEGHDFDR